jgi:hypothetical protein
MKTLLIGLVTLSSVSAFADIKVCGRVQQIWTESSRNLTQISIRQHNGNNHAAPISSKIKETALTLANASIQNKNAVFCGYIQSDEFVDVTLMNFKN